MKPIKIADDVIISGTLTGLGDIEGTVIELYNIDGVPYIRARINAHYQILTRRQSVSGQAKFFTKI
ncbi:MAG: hypothetical protein LBV75_03845 [Paludibacter sp.]|jgi:hypothetical protein|nr:hypothetical protein [Paludibacter sp.]